MVFSSLEKITGGKTRQLLKDFPVENLIIDSRKAVVDEASVFFAIQGPRHDGHQYIASLYDLGVRQFVVEKAVAIEKLTEANILVVPSVVGALQAIVQFHRQQFKLPVVGITGSNGKTIIKEWLFQLLSPEYSIVKNPGSYNSQVGVPLSVWAIGSFHQLGIFEAGISKPGEMKALEKVIQPSIGIFTNIGTAHDEGFESIQQKISEKLQLFSRVKTLVYCSDHSEVDLAIRQQNLPGLSWGSGKNAVIRVKEFDSVFHITYGQKEFTVILPFADLASIENSFHCIALLLHLGYSEDIIRKRISELRAVPMRLELKEGINNCQVIDDTYNNDLGGLQISLDFLANQHKTKKTVILSDVLQSGLNQEKLAADINAMLRKNGVMRLVGIGPFLTSVKNSFSKIDSIFFKSTEDFLERFDFGSLENEIILVKGARIFHFEKIVRRIQRKTHGTVMQIDLGKMVHNLNFFKSKLKPGVKLMVMVKAFAYGSGSEEVASLMQYHKVDYLGVAYADEGVELRKKNISLPIMVMNPTEESFGSLLSNKLEPAMYSAKMLLAFARFVSGRDATIHIEAETGMHRLGLSENDLPEVIGILQQNKNIKIASVFSHLSGSDEAVHDNFSKEQFDRYLGFYERLSSDLKIKPLRHILNSAGILRLHDFQMDMVRLGIGLYGVNPTDDNFSELQPVATLKTVISQIQKISKGETIGYGRRGSAERESTIATIAIGYADGFSRSFSRGKGVVLVNGKRAAVIGNVCMDMTMVDITGINASEGDEVIIFGDGLSIHDVANSVDTIPYEILTNTSARVKRVFIAEGI
ncbi:bifunctional UDP-N-acetylmuramoyl-tripeptide:D-alanyl-D-alanine ligase/alanine racemase [Cytophagales bacterium WSM2-2]|nr:bifunctional UDP-N-acetylmuramoyl-tripeptide:D-alanyl-D-alanine ligase/alanine racemase [Cytophagales bacterium WSM2-2]